jgi:microcystin-dependent protein
MDSMIGSIVMFAGNFAPRNYALCQGQLLSIAQNTALFSILGTTYGGDGRVTFALPDLRGRSPIGSGNGPGLTPITPGEQAGTPSVTLLNSNLPAHSHLVNCDNTGQSSTTPGGQIPGLSDDRTTALPIYSSARPNATMNPAVCGLAGSNLPFSNADPFLGINFIICTQGIFPSRN